MRKGEQTRQRVIETAARVMNQHGYNGSGMSELMRETGLAKGGLYRHFESKQALAVEAFQFAFTTIHNLRFSHLDRVPNAVDKLQRFLENFAAVPSPIPGGCPILNTGTENDDGNPALLHSAQQAFDATVKRLAAIIREGQQRGEIRPEIAPEELALFLFCSLEGGIFASRLQGTRRRLKVVARQLHRHLESEVRVCNLASGISKRPGV